MQNGAFEVSNWNKISNIASPIDFDLYIPADHHDLGPKV